MEEQTPSRFKVWKAAFVWYSILGVLIYLGASSAAVRDDFRGDLVTHSACKILGKNSHDGKGGMRYSIESSCGDYSTNRQTFGYVQAGALYDFNTTKGNWAHSPYLMSADMHQPVQPN